ncbi:MAG: N-acetyltransferase family protein [Sphingobium sp.]
MSEIAIRLAVEADLPAIVAIYNESIPGGWSTADTKPITVADRLEWFRKFDPARRPIWVAEDAGTVVGTVYLSSFYHDRPAYSATAEVSVYVALSHRKMGLGMRLKRFAIEQCPKLGVTTLMSFYFEHNQATARINEQLGFVTMGHLTEIADVGGVKRGLIIAGLRIPEACS